MMNGNNIKVDIIKNVGRFENGVIKYCYGMQSFLGLQNVLCIK